jgi:hypothetical protein
METKGWNQNADKPASEVGRIGQTGEPSSEVDRVGTAQNSAPDAADDAVEAITAAINKNSVNESKRG